MRRTAFTLAVVSALALPGCVVAWGACDHTAPRDATIDLAGAREVRVEARAGELEIVGRPGLSAVTASGTACADSERRLEGIELVAERSGDVVEIVVDIPEGRGNARLDLRVEVPSELPLVVRDSSGDADIRGVASLDVRDSSGDLWIEDVDGDARVEDSSGEIHVADVRGRVTVTDSSGDIDVRRVTSLEVDSDSSGDIDAREVDGDVRVRRDSSGDIDVATVGGDFVVGSDSSGGIYHRDVAGRVDVPTDD